MKDLKTLITLLFVFTAIIFPVNKIYFFARKKAAHLSKQPLKFKFYLQFGNNSSKFLRITCPMSSWASIVDPPMCGVT